MKIISFFCRSNAFETQLAHIRPRLYRTAYSWCHNAAIAEDLVQETLAKSLKNAAQLQDTEKFNGWIFSILSNCWRDFFRQHRDMDDIDEIADHQCVNPVTPEDEHIQADIVQRVREAIAKLPLGQRQVVTLVDLEEFSYIEVAGILDIPVGTVMSRLCRARAALQTLLKAHAPQKTTQLNMLRRIK